MSSGHTAQAAANRRGILYMCAAMAGFVANDALVKYASQSLPAAQLIFLRGVMATTLVLAVAQGLGAMPRIALAAQPQVMVRAGVDAVATLMYLWALFHLPMANAIAINLSTPIFLSIFAAVFLREQVGAVRWAAIGAGFLGVLLIIQPQSQGFNAFALLCLLATILHAVRDLLTRRIPASTPAILITLATAATITVVSGLVSLVQGWQGFGARELGLLGLASVFLACGYYFIISSMRQGDMSLTAPFRYSGLLLALVLGYLVWGDVPNTLAWCGIALLVGSGLFMLWCERLRVRRLAAS